MIDLHCHSIYSDGALAPEELLERAVNQQLRCFSLTDHDTIEGYERLNKAAEDVDIKIIPGIELSVRWKKYDIHILGYNISATESLKQVIQQQNDNRIQRAKKISDALGKIGVMDAYQKACDVAGHIQVARPHFAQVLINEKKARDMQAAFKQYLGTGKCAYVPTPWISIQDAVQVIIQSGGQAVIAHPHKYKMTRTKLHEFIKDFIDAGGEGMEVVSGDMQVNQIQEMAATSLRFHLLASTGSDYHSDTVSRIKIGRQRQLPDICTPIWQKWNI